MFFMIALLAIVLAPGIEAQAPAGGTRIALSPVPIWPQDGDTSQLPKGQYVFYDPPSGEYVVYFAQDGAGATSAQPTVLRFGGHALVDPEVTFVVASASDGSIHYKYDVANGSRARQSIQKMSILVFSDSSPRASRGNWVANVAPHSIREFASPTMGGASIDWTSNNAALSIAPGSAALGFTIDSTSLPGFTTMTFRGDSQSNQYSSDAVASLPKEVRDQIARVMNTTWDTKSRMVISPRFSKGTSQSTIAQNYLFGLQSLVLEGKLDSSSPFVQRARQLLSTQIESQDQMRLDAGGLDFIKQAKPGLETTIANALEAALAQ